MKHNEEFSSLETTTCVLTFEFAICKFKLSFMRENSSSAGPSSRRDTCVIFCEKPHLRGECYMLQHLHGLYRQLFSNFPEYSLQGRKINFKFGGSCQCWLSACHVLRRCGHAVNILLIFCGLHSAHSRYFDFVAYTFFYAA